MQVSIRYSFKDDQFFVLSIQAMLLSNPVPIGMKLGAAGLIHRQM
jgi:hypothetical protein